MQEEFEYLAAFQLAEAVTRREIFNAERVLEGKSIREVHSSELNLLGLGNICAFVHEDHHVSDNGTRWYTFKCFHLDLPNTVTLTGDWPEHYFNMIRKKHERVQM